MDFLNGQQFTVESHTVAAAYAGSLLRQFGATVEHASALDPQGDGERFLPPTPAPTLGQDNESVLAAMGHSFKAIAGLRADGSIGERPG